MLLAEIIKNQMKIRQTQICFLDRGPKGHTNGEKALKNLIGGRSKNYMPFLHKK